MEPADNAQSHYALQLAFQIMKERCRQLQSRLATVEEENISLRQDEIKDSISILKLSEENENVYSQKKQIEELKKQKLQLAQHIFMVSSENRQLWKRLTRLTRTNKSLGKQLNIISDRLKQHPSSEVINTLIYSHKEIPEIFKDNLNNVYNLPSNEEKEHSLEEISLWLINSITAEKSQMEKQYDKILELQTNSEINFKNIGFTYPEDLSIDSLEQLKYHDIKLTEIKEELLIQQNKLKNVLYNVKKMKKNDTCSNCKNNIEKLTCQTGTQFDSHCSLKKENRTTQTSFPNYNFTPEKKLQTLKEKNICPLCGLVYKKSVSFELFHEHVVNHFKAEITEGF